jgi:hypothetical protein
MGIEYVNRAGDTGYLLTTLVVVNSRAMEWTRRIVHIIESGVHGASQTLTIAQQ